MLRGVRQVAVAASLGLLAFGGNGAAAARVDGAMRISGGATAPIGHLAFCAANPAECISRGAQGAVMLGNDSWRQLVDINLVVNQTVAPVTDRDLYRNEEYWTIPHSEGDCEDYVLLKRKLLADRGWPTGALLVAVVFDEVGEGHAVLVARTDGGDYVLDNKVDDIRLWHQTRYRFVKRQSVGDPKTWVYVGDPRWSTEATAAQ